VIVAEANDGPAFELQNGHHRPAPKGAAKRRRRKEDSAARGGPGKVGIVERCAFRSGIKQVKGNGAGDETQRWAASRFPEDVERFVQHSRRFLVRAKRIA